MIKLLRTWASILLMGFGGFLGVISAMLAPMALFGALEIDGFGERILSCFIYILLAAGGFGMLRAGLRLKNPRSFRPAAKTAPASRPEEERALPQKPEPVQTVAAKPSEVTVERAWRSFSAEEQKRFDAQVYQYSQDVGRDGNMPKEAAAAHRGLVFVDGRPVPEAVAQRLEEMRREAKAKEEGRLLRQEIDACADFMRRMKIIAVLYTEYDLRSHLICEDKTTGQAWEVWLKVVGHSGVSFASTSLEVFEKPPRSISAEELAVRMGRKQADGKPCVNCSGKVGMVRELSMTETRDGAFSFEKTVVKRDVVQVDEKHYLRVINYECASGGNGRPVYRMSQDYYEVESGALELLTAESGLEHVNPKPAMRSTDGGTGALF